MVGGPTSFGQALTDWARSSILPDSQGPQGNHIICHNRDGSCFVKPHRFLLILLAKIKYIHHENDIIACLQLLSL